jgi:hypothetical protein
MFGKSKMTGLRTYFQWSTCVVLAKGLPAGRDRDVMGGEVGKLAYPLLNSLVLRQEVSCPPYRFLYLPFPLLIEMPLRTTSLLLSNHSIFPF